jgi:type IV secretion system protein VirD4
VTLKGIMAAFAAPLAIWGNPLIDKATSRDDFDLRDIRKRKMSIYVCIPAGEVHQAGFILNLLFSQLVNENVKELPENNPELKHQCLLMLDECTAMGKVAMLAKGVGYMAGYNLRLAIVIQDREQLEAVYGKSDAHNLVSNMGVVMYYTPNDIEEAEKYSKAIGYDTVSNTSKQRPNGMFGGGRSSGSETESAHSRALMLPQELLAMNKAKQLIMRGGMPVVMADKITYYADKYFEERFTAVPMRQVVINGKTRSVPVPPALPTPGWRYFKTLIASTNYYLGEDFADLVDDEAASCTDQLLEKIVNEPEAWPRQSVEAAAEELARRKCDEFLLELGKDNREEVAKGPYRELVMER